MLGAVAANRLGFVNCFLHYSPVIHRGMGDIQ